MLITIIGLTIAGCGLIASGLSSGITVAGWGLLIAAIGLMCVANNIG